MERIVSAQNSRIKNVQTLIAKSKERKTRGLFIVEGVREISLALAGSYGFDSVFYCPELFTDTEMLRFVNPKILCEVSAAVFGKIACRENSGGILAIAGAKKLDLSSLHLPENPFVILLESVEKPGNLGAILRTADAAGVDALIVCDPLTDVYNPNTIRSSIGCVFTVPVAVSDNAGALSFLKERHIRTFAAELQASQCYHETDFRGPSAIVMGTEAEGLSPFWLKNADAGIKIPMRGKIDSLNVSVSTAVITFEAMRQRSGEKSVDRVRTVGNS
ncbi:MAG: RNA methyltransferase [Dysgonamonadaceae bacterium]|jgi:TrmH family RNA methyltransferase|nr:RNA methyltransferase [Dysgonamonadaceae bacterium]